MKTQEKEIHERLAALTPADQDRVLGYIRQISGEPLRGEPGHNLLRFAGIWTDEEADAVSRAIEEGCETVDLDSWKMDPDGR
ncbi:MAG TPA: hypothetical protein VF584_24415 [Longimicrobium sp.]|jgi:hypothetical protein